MTNKTISICNDLDDATYRQQCAIQTLDFILEGLANESTGDVSEKALYARMPMYRDMLAFVSCGLWDTSKEIHNHTQAIFAAHGIKAQGAQV